VHLRSSRLAAAGVPKWRSQGSNGLWASHRAFGAEGLPIVLQMRTQAMEVVVFSGLQGAGKSTWFAERYAQTHVRLSLDVLGTRNRETVLLHACLAVQQRVVVDNTNVTASARTRYALLAKAAGCSAVLVVFHVPTEVALARNAQREGKARVPDRAILGTAAKREDATWDEGFDRIIDVFEVDGERRTEERTR